LFEELVGRVASVLRRRNRNLHDIGLLSDIKIQERAAVLLSGDHRRSMDPGA
jgi:hypothetical protein